MSIPMKSASELNFQAQADRQRSRQWLAAKVAAAGALLVGVSLLVPEKWLPWLGIPGTVLIFASLILFFTVPGLHCPDCSKSAEDFDIFCPSCGTGGLRRILSAAKCDGCHHTLDHYKTRNYSIHFCTHCGHLLDRRGLNAEALGQYQRHV